MKARKKSSSSSGGVLHNAFVQRTPKPLAAANSALGVSSNACTVPIRHVAATGTSRCKAWKSSNAANLSSSSVLEQNQRPSAQHTVSSTSSGCKPPLCSWWKMQKKPWRTADHIGVVSMAAPGRHRNASTGMRTGGKPPAESRGFCTAFTAGLSRSRKNSAAAVAQGATFRNSVHNASLPASALLTPCTSLRAPSTLARMRAASAEAAAVASQSSVCCSRVACLRSASKRARSWLACSAVMSELAACRRATSSAAACCRPIDPVTSSSTRSLLISWAQAIFEACSAARA
mmetsp:Transcript_104998/g.185968  ORF Transcript_104998/g.185968 Transcript_104998/m.185968 type:complete len:289 (-) Transcript_104998:533-1399(-)